MTKIISNSTWTLRAARAASTLPSSPSLPLLLFPTKHKHNEADDDDEAPQLGEEVAAVQDVDNKKCSCCDFNAGDEAEAAAGEQLTKCHSTSTATPALAASSL